MRSIKRGMPIKSLDNGQFNKKVFLRDHPMNQRLAAKADLLETIYLILNKEQKKKFQMLMGAHQYKMQLNNGAYCQGKQCHGKMGQGIMCDGKKCDGKMCKGKVCQKPKCQGHMCRGQK